MAEKKEKINYIETIEMAAKDGNMGSGVPHSSKPFIKLIACGILAICEVLKKQ